jgi:hypothetical protein
MARDENDRLRAGTLPSDPFEGLSRAQPESERRIYVPEILWGEKLGEPLAPIRWLCPALKITSGALTLFAGNAYAGKSLALADLGLSIAVGQPVWGVFSCRRGRVLWLDYDGQGERVSRERFQRLARARGIPNLAELGNSLGY